MVVVLTNTDWCNFGSVDCTTPEFCIVFQDRGLQAFYQIFPVLAPEETGIRKLLKSKVHGILLITLKSPYLCLSRKLTIF